MTVQTLVFSDASRIIAGVVLITIVTIEIGGWFLTKIARGDVPLTEFQKSFARAGHGHAGMLVTLGLVCLVLADGADLTGFLGWWSRVGVPLAAILVSAGFFAASAGKGVTKPNRFIVVLWLGAVALATGVLTLGLGLLTT